MDRFREKYSALVDSKVKDVPEVLKADVDKAGKVLIWLFMQAFAYELNREYEKAEALHRAALAIDENHAGSYVNLAGAVGRQGRFAEAVELSRIAADMAPGMPVWRKQSLMASACSLGAWLAASGKEQEAREVLSACPEPGEDQRDISMYHSMRCACFAALKDVEHLQAEIPLSLKYDFSDEPFPEYNRALLERDMVYDSFRDEEWFVQLLGSAQS